jgi:hypothetical protein
MTIIDYSTLLLGVSSESAKAAWSHFKIVGKAHRDSVRSFSEKTSLIDWKRVSYGTAREGGVRADSFVNGGLLPPLVRGTKLAGAKSYIHICDWCVRASWRKHAKVSVHLLKIGL